MAILATGTGLARVIGVVSIPILTRLYSPEDFGVMAVFVALVAILTPLLTLRYVLALPLPRHDGLAMNLLFLSASLLVVMGTVLGLGLALFAAPLLSLLSMEVLAPWWWLIVIALIGSGLYELLSLWATRRREYRAIACTQITQSVVGSAVKIGLGYLGVGPIGLLVGSVFSKTSGIGYLSRKFFSEFDKNFKRLRKSRLRCVAIRYISFPGYRLPSQFMLVVSQSAPMFLIAYYYDSYTVGQFALAFAIVKAPTSLISGSISKAFYAEIARISTTPKTLFRVAKSVFKRVSIIGLPIAVGLIVLSPPAFPRIFGTEWQLAGVLAAILAIGIIPNFVGQTIIQALTVTRRNHIFFLFNTSRVFVVIASLMIPAIAGLTIIWVVISFTLALAIQRLVQVFLIFRWLKKDLRTDILA